MVSILDEFDGLLGDGELIDPIGTSKEYIQEYNRFKRNNQLTYSGVSKDNIIQCINVDESSYMQWKHVSLTLDVSVLREISKQRLVQFKIPHFVDELSSIGDRNNSGFGYNEYGRNHVKNIIMSPSIFAIADRTFAFYRCLESIYFPENSRLSVLGNEAFAFCEKLTTVDLSQCKYIKKLGSKLFKESSVKKLKINSVIREITEDTFEGSNISTVFIDEHKYTFNNFIERLALNNYNAFWM